MSDQLRDDLRTEYQMLQQQYESFDERALSIKFVIGPILAGGVGLASDHGGDLLIAGVVVASICLWILELIWKNFQYCYSGRINTIERWFVDQEGEIKPFQIYTSWVNDFNSAKNDWKLWIRRGLQPFVRIPYLPVSIFGIVAILVN